MINERPLTIERLLTTEELAELLHTTPAGITNLRHRGAGPRGVRASGRILYPESFVLEWLESRADEPRPAA
jgi:hypothetical protein